MTKVAKSGNCRGVPYLIRHEDGEDVKVTFGTTKRTFETWDRAIAWLESESAKMFRRAQ